MNREELITQKKDLQKQLDILFQTDLECNHRVKGFNKAYGSLMKKLVAIQRELDKIENHTYNNSVWITNFIGNSYESLKAARFDLINKIKNLPGVEVGEDKTGVVLVKVYTEYKIYYYTIHAHYRVEEYNPHVGKDIFGNETTVYDTKQIYQAWVDGSGNNWSWRY